MKRFDPRLFGSGGIASRYLASVMADNPISYYRLGEPQGSTVLRDERGIHAGAFVGVPLLGQPGALTGDGNTAMVLDGSGAAYAQVPAWLDIPAPPCSIEGWVRHNGVDFVLDDTIAGAVNPGTRALRLMAATVSGITMQLGVFTEAGNAHFDWTPAGDTGWHYIVGTISAGGLARFYFDAVEKQNAATGYSGGVTQAFRIGTTNDVGTPGLSSWPGGIDEVAVYGSELSPARITARFAAAH